MPIIPVAEYRPDVVFANNTYSDTIHNVYAADNSYIPAPSFESMGLLFEGTPLNAYGVRFLDGSIHIYIGTASKIFRITDYATGFVDVTREGDEGGYHANREHNWSFTVFGNTVIAVNQNDKPQIIEENSPHFRNMGSEEKGWPPHAGIVKNWGNFVALMNLTDNLNRVHWSGLNDADTWKAGEKNSDWQDFEDGGVVQGSTETTNPLIFLQSAIYTATFIPGSKLVFSFQKIHDKRGVKAINSLVSRGGMAFFADEGGFFQITSDGAVTPIGFEKVDRTIFEKLNAEKITDIRSTIDQFYNRAYWMIDYDNDGLLDEVLCYDWVLQKWTTLDAQVYALISIFTFGTSLDSLDSVSMHVDELPYSLDSKLWQGGATVLIGIGQNIEGKPVLGAFSGKNKQAIVTTSEWGATDRSMQRLNGVTLLCDAPNATVSYGLRNSLASDVKVNWMPERSQSYNTGYVHGRARARFYTFQITIPEGENWNHIKGIDVEPKSAGIR